MFFKALTRLYKNPFLIIIDLLLLNLGLLLSFFIRFDNLLFLYISYTYFVAMTLIGFLVLYFSNLYHRMWRYASIGELFSIIKITALINILLIIYSYFTYDIVPRSILLINIIIDIFLLGGFRFSLRLLKEHLINQNNTSVHQRVLIVGAGDAGEMIIREMNKHPEMDKEVVGLIDDDPHKFGLEIHGKKVLGNRLAIPKVINDYYINEVIIAIPSARGEDVKELYQLSNRDDIKVSIVPGVFEIINGDVNLNQIREVKVEDLLRREQVRINTNEITAYLSHKTVMVTGGSGSIGSELCRQVASYQPHKLIIFDINENNTYFLERELADMYPDIPIISVIGSIRDRDKLISTFKKYRPEVVFHAAAHKHVPLMENNPEEAVKNNIMGTRNVIEIADQFAVERFVLISTDKAVNPTNVMGATKRVAEMLIQSISKKSNTRFMAVRFGNVLGSRGSVIPLFKKQIAGGGPVTVTHPEIKRYFMTIPEAVELVIQTGSLGRGGEVFVLDMGEPVRIVDLARDLIELSGFKVDEDIAIEFTGLRPGEKLFEELLNDKENNIAETEHERIFITQLHPVDDSQLDSILHDLESLVNQEDSAAIIKALVELVDTYQPKRDNIREFELARQQKEVAAGEE